MSAIVTDYLRWYAMLGEHLFGGGHDGLTCTWCGQIANEGKLRVVVGDYEVVVAMETEQIGAQDLPRSRRDLMWNESLFWLFALVFLAGWAMPDKLLNVPIDVYPIDTVLCP